MLNNLSAYQKIALILGLPVSAILLFLLFRKQDEDEELYATTSRKAVIEVNVPKEAMSAVIGRQGFNIKRIQEATKTRIHFKDNTENSELRVAIIKGKEFSDVQEAESLILKTISDAADFKTEEILVPPKACGFLIGRNGETIRSMCRESRAKILINSNSEEDRDNNGYVKILLKGTEDQIIVAKALIEEKLSSEEAFRQRLELTAAKQRLRKSKLTVSDNDDKSNDQEVEANISLEKLVPDHTDGYLEVFISCVDTAGHFWVQIVGSKAIHLDRLMEDMTCYYSKANYPKKFHEVTSLNIGDIVAARFTSDDSWYRVRVIEVLGNQATVFYVDFGDSQKINVTQLQTLRSDFLTLPFQAIECYLANVVPINEDWSEEANILFEQLSFGSQWKVIMSRTVNYKDTIPFVELVNTNGEKDININKELVERGFALWQSISIGDISSGSSDSSVDMKSPERFSQPVIPDMIPEPPQLSQSYNSQTVDNQNVIVNLTKETHFQRSDARHLPQKSHYQSLDIRHLPQESRFQSTDIRYLPQESRFQSTDVRHLPQESRFQSTDVRHLPQKSQFQCVDVRHLPQETHFQNADARQQKKKQRPKEKRRSRGNVKEHSPRVPQEMNVPSRDVKHILEETKFKCLYTDLQEKPTFPIVGGVEDFLKETTASSGDIKHLSNEMSVASGDSKHIADDASFKSITNIKKESSYDIEPISKETTAPSGDIKYLSTEMSVASGDSKHIADDASFKSVTNIKKESSYDIEPISKETSAPRSDIEHLQKEIDHKLLVSSPIPSPDEAFYSANSSTPNTISTRHSAESVLSHDNGYSSSIHTNDSLTEEKSFNDTQHDVQEKSVTINGRLSGVDDSFEAGKSALSESMLYNKTLDSSEMDSSIKELSSTSSLSSKSFMFFQEDKAITDEVKSSSLLEKDEYSSNNS